MELWDTLVGTTHDQREAIPCRTYMLTRVRFRIYYNSACQGVYPSQMEHFRPSLFISRLLLYHILDSFSSCYSNAFFYSIK